MVKVDLEEEVYQDLTQIAIVANTFTVTDTVKFLIEQYDKNDRR